MFTVFNAYDVGDGQYEGVLRWGTQEGTSVGGNTLRYVLDLRPVCLVFVCSAHSIVFASIHLFGIIGIRWGTRMQLITILLISVVSMASFTR